MTRKTFIPRTVVSLSIAALFALPYTVAQSQNDAAQTEKKLPSVPVVGVTPIEGLEVPINQVPSNVQILTAKDIEQQGITNVADLLNNNLGSVTVTNAPGNPYQNDISYRGFQATSLLGAPVGISVYFDGIRMNSPFGSTVNWDLIPSNAISSLSLLPGSNPVFGLNTLGGALVVNTKNGKDFEGTSATSTFGSFGRRALRAEKGWQDLEKDADYFLSANWDKQDGYRSHSSSDVQQIYGKARMRNIAHATNGELSFALVNNTLSGTQALPSSMYSNPSSAYTWPDSTENQSGFINLKLNRQLENDQLLAGNIYYQKTRSKSTNSNLEFDDGCFDSSGNLVTTATNCGPGNFSSPGTAKNTLLTAASQANVAPNGAGFARYTGDLNSSLVFGNTKEDTVGISSQWTNLAKLSGKNNSMTLGSSLNYSKISYYQETWLAQMIDFQAVINTTNPRYWSPLVNGGTPASGTNGFTLSGLIKNVNLSSKTTNLSLFFTDTLEVNEKLDVTASASYNISLINQNGANNQFLNDDGGARWTSVSGTTFINPAYVGAKSLNSGTGAISTQAAPTGLQQLGPETNSLTGSHKYHRLNPAIGFNFKPNQANNLNIFGGYSESMRAPTSVELSCADPARPCALPTGFNGDPELKAVVARTVELGMRGLLNENTLWNFAVYDTRTSNDIQFMYSGATSLGFFNNVGDTERRGFEAGIARKFDKFFLAANYGFVDAHFRSAFQNANGDDIVAGNKMPGIPNQSLKVRLAYDVNPKFLVGTNVQFVSGQYAYGDETNTNGKTPGYGIANLDLHYKVNDEFKVFCLVNNILDKSYAPYGLIGTDIYNAKVNDKFLTPAPGRAIWVGLNYSFGGKTVEKKNKANVDND
jgi:outer membrane receptor protein involved in Fe transport